MVKVDTVHEQLFVLKWLHEHNLFSSLIAMERETGISLHKSSDRTDIVRELCLTGQLEKLGEVVTRMFPDESGVHGSIIVQRLKEKLAGIGTKEDVIAFISDLRSAKRFIPPTTLTSFEEAVISADPSKHNIFTNWSVAKGRYELFELLVKILQSVYPDRAPQDLCSVCCAGSSGALSEMICTLHGSNFPKVPSSKFATPVGSPLPVKSGPAKPPRTDDFASSLRPVGEYRDGSNQPVRSATFSNAGHLVAIGTNSQSLVVCDAADLRVVGKSHKVHFGSVYTCAWSPDDAWIATGSNDQTIRLSPVAQVLGHSAEKSGSRIQLEFGTVRSLSFAQEGMLVCGVSGDGIVRGIDPFTGLVEWSLRCVDGFTTSVDCQGSLIVVGSSTGSVRVVDHRANEFVWDLPPRTGSAVAAIQGTSVAVGTEMGDVSLWDIRSPVNPVWEIQAAHSGSVRGVDFDRSSRHIATASFDKSSKVFEAVTGELVTTLEGHRDRVVGVAWSPRDDRLVTCGSDSTVVLWGSALT